MLDRVLTHLATLVSCDTQNPPRSITRNDHIYQYCSGILRDSGCVVDITDLGNGCVNLLATRGSTHLLFNCHLDTVPTDPAWTCNPFEMVTDQTNAKGLGVCDIKGAAACLLAAAETTDGPLAILLSSDEEAGESTCIHHFVQAHTEFDTVVVCEPTNAKAVTKHRGIETYELIFTGNATHSSEPTAHMDNALHHATAWAAKAIDIMHGHGGENLRFNIGVINGGVKTNIAASSAVVRFGIRHHAETDVPGVLDRLLSLIDDPDRAVFKTCFQAPPLDSGEDGASFMKRFDLPSSGPVDFWTEAALFGAAGLCTLVLGPGNISQAHSSDETVPLDDLREVADIYTKIVEHQPYCQTQVVSP